MASSTKKEKKEKKRRREDATVASEHDRDASAADRSTETPSHHSQESSMKERKTKKKTKKKKEASSKDASHEGESSSENHGRSKEDHKANDSDSDDEPRRDNARTSNKHARKRLERKKLLEKVPKVDEHGIAYTKLQLRRMMKRVKKGLHPVETPQEEQERRSREAELKREEEKELAGLMVISKSGSDDESSDDGNQDTDNAHDEHESDHNEDVDTDSATPGEKPQEETTRPKKKARTKPIPTDYVCMACKNEHKPSHWIYDCPSKVRMPGVNQVAKNLKGVHNPECKVFVSGLSFDTKQKDLVKLFEGCGKISHCKLVQFEDTKRCKGTAFITFESKDDTYKALKLSGMKHTLKDGKELTLKVTKALSRALTKKGGKSPNKPKTLKS